LFTQQYVVTDSMLKELLWLIVHTAIFGHWFYAQRTVMV